MKGFLFGAWIAAAMALAIWHATKGTINIPMVLWGVATFAGWTVLVFAGSE